MNLVTEPAFAHRSCGEGDERRILRVKTSDDEKLDSLQANQRIICENLLVHEHDSMCSSFFAVGHIPRKDLSSVS